MKINLLTFHCALSYGAALQTYALGRILQGMHHKVSLINLRPPSMTPDFTLHPGACLQRWKFTRFIRTRCPPLTAPSRRPGTAVRQGPFADAWIVGSDQVWNPEITGPFVADYFLDGEAVRGRRIAYAASFGRDVLTWEDALRNDGRRWLAAFDAISVRETSGLRICHELGAHNVTQTLDPTLLLGDFSELLPGRSVQRPVLLAMVFKPGKQFVDALRHIGTEMGLHPTQLGRRAGASGFGAVPHPGVPRWVRSFHDAAFVVTDSFHGLAFALIFNKPFIVIPANPERFCRLHELLVALRLEDRIFDSYGEVLKSRRWREPVPYQEVNRLLACKRQESMDFLNRSLASSP